MRVYAFAAALIFYLPLAVHAGGNHLKAIYSLKNLKHYAGTTYPLPQNLKNIGLTEIFSIPKRNAVGSNAIYNSIASISFNKNKFDVDIIRRDFIEYVSGGDLVFLKQFSDSIIGYGQSRRFVLFDINTGKFRIFDISPGILQSITDIQPYNANALEFIFEIQEYEDHPFPIANYALARINTQTELEKKDNRIKLTDEPHRIKAKFILEKKVEGKRKKHWIAHNKMIFVFSENSIDVFDGNFKPAKHPLLSAFKPIQDMVANIYHLIIHPSLPIAIVVDRGKMDGDPHTWLINWQDKNATEIHLLYDRYQIYNLDFSPDGKWLVFAIDQQLFLSAVDPLLQHSIGPPISLGELRDRVKYAWIQSPQALVAATGFEIVKWDISEASVKNYHVYQ